MEKRIVLERRGKKPSQVSELNLDNVRAIQIEGLSDEYTSLETLSLINVGLTTLKGFPKLPELRRLELGENRISNSLVALKDCPKLSHLNLSNNKIKDLEALEPLKSFESLTHLDLFNNEICNMDDYRSKIFKLLPGLKYLDDADADENEEDVEGKNGALDDSDGDEEDDDDDDDVVDDEDEDASEDDSDDEDGPGLAAIYNDNLEDEEEGDDFDEEGEDEEDDDIEEEEAESEEPRGKRRKVEEDEEESGGGEGGSGGKTV